MKLHRLFQKMQEDVAENGHLSDAYLPMLETVILSDFYHWCKENGIEKGSVKHFAKEHGILLE